MTVVSQSSVWTSALPFIRGAAWVSFPLAIAAGDMAFRWQAGLPPRLSQPSNWLLSLCMSAVFWWAASRLIAASPWRKLLAGLVGFGAACAMTASWQLSRQVRFPDQVTLGYLLREPANAILLGAHGLSWRDALLAGGLGALWMLALLAYRPRGRAAEGSTPEKSASLRPALFRLAALAGAFFIALHSLPPIPLHGAPYSGDFHLTRELGWAGWNLATGQLDTLDVAQRRDTLPPAAKIERPNVLIFVAESLRRDRMSLWGHDRPTTPRLERFVREQPGTTVRFDRAWTASALTPFSLATMFTGLHIGRGRQELHRAPLLWHYARHAGVQSMLVSPQDWQWSNMHAFFLADRPPDFEATARHFDAEIVNDTGVHDLLAAEKAAQLISKFERDTPFLAVVQSNATHFPFLPDEPSPWPMRTQRARYDASVHLTDVYFGEVVDALARAGELDDTVILLTSDHGEFLYEADATDTAVHKRQMERGRLRVESCHPTIAQIPMLLHVPRRWMDKLELDSQTLQENAAKVVSNVDIFATVLDLWSLEAAGAVDGLSLVRPISEQRRALCFTSAGWALGYLSGLAVFTAEEALYVRADFERPHQFDTSDASATVEYGPGRPWSQADHARLEEVCRQSEQAAIFVDHIEDVSESLLKVATPARDAGP